MKRSTALATAALVLASAATIAPAYADEADDLAPARVQRNWNGGGNAGSGQRAHTNTPNGHPTHALAPVVVTRPAAAPVAHEDDDDNDNGRRAAQSEHGWNGEQHGHREHSRWSREYDLDPAEAERIRQAHRESDRHVTLRRDRDEDDYVPSYYTPRRHWWHSWW